MNFIGAIAGKVVSGIAGKALSGIAGKALSSVAGNGISGIAGKAISSVLGGGKDEGSSPIAQSDKSLLGLGDEKNDLLKEIADLVKSITGQGEQGSGNASGLPGLGSLPSPGSLIKSLMGGGEEEQNPTDKLKKLVGEAQQTGLTLPLQLAQQVKGILGGKLF